VGEVVAAFLITGNPGSGKTTLARELSKRGCAAIDADELAGWETHSGEEVTEPADVDDAWRMVHRWVWRERLMSDLVNTYAAVAKDVYVCGIARNQRELLQLFDAVFLLAMDDVTQAARLRTADNARRGSGIRAQILEGRAAFEHEARSVGAVVLDARLPPAVLADVVMQHAAAARRSW
jgi:gluconate kinase